jgi:aldose 1-epimerase
MRTGIYTAEQGFDHNSAIVRLTDAAHRVEVSIIPSAGNRAYRMLIAGKNILYFPFEDPAEIKTGKHLNGIPFLAPWANRMPGGLHANGRYHPFNMDSILIRRDQNGIPIHGLLTASPLWKVVEATADAESASVTSRLEFGLYPHLMENWPFAHDYEMTYRLAEGILEVSLVIFNRGSEPMPLAVGFHPYFQLPDVPIEDATAWIPVRSHVETDNLLVATGETKPVDFKNPVALRDRRFDDGFTDLVRDDSGRAIFSFEGKGRKIEVTFGAKYPVAIVYAPAGHDYICFEPMTAVTNGVNLAHEGKYSELQTVPAGESWQESFWIQATGF